MLRYRLLSLVCFLLALVSLPSCRVTDLPVWGPAEVSAAAAKEVDKVADVAYYDGPDADARCHRLDLFLPKGKKNFPVVVLVHGGGWVMGDNRCCGLYSSLGEFLASQGIAAALPNYRLSPGVKHPEHVRDVARAVRWVRAHLADHGGCPEQLFLAGHSAGGHLVSLLATDEQFLRAEGLTTPDVKGVIAISGVYDIPAGNLAVTLGGPLADAFHLDCVTPLRGENGAPWCQRLLPGVPLRLNVFGPAFGDDARQRALAAPLNHVRPGLPPFLLFSAEKDLPTLPAMAQAFHEALQNQGCASQLVRVERRNHNSIVFQAIQPDDPVARAMLDFIGKHRQ